MTDKLELKSSHEVVYTVNVADVESIFYCKPTDPDILTVLMKDGKRLYCDEVCPIDSLQKEPVRSDFEMALAEMVDNAQKRVVEPWVIAAQWKDELINLAKSEEPISEELNEAAIDYAESVDYRGFSNAPWNFVQDVFKAGANWQKKQFEKDYADLCNGIVTAKGIAVAMAYDNGVADAKKQIMAKAIDVTVHIDAGGYPYTPEIELYDYDRDVPLAKEGDKYKVVLIKEE